MLINGMVHLEENGEPPDCQMKKSRFERIADSTFRKIGFDVDITKTRYHEAQDLFDKAFLPAMDDEPEKRKWPDYSVFIDAYSNYFKERIEYLSDKNLETRPDDLETLKKIFADTSAILNGKLEKKLEIDAAFQKAETHKPAGHAEQSEIEKQFEDLANALINRNGKDWDIFFATASNLYERVKEEENRKISMAYNYLLLSAAALGAPFKKLMDMDVKDETLYFRWQNRTVTSLRERGEKVAVKIIYVPL
jgi:hypothetical protein